MPWRKAWTPLTRALAVYLIVAVATSLTGLSPQESLGQLHRDAHKAWVAVLLLVALPLVDRKRVEAGLSAGALAAAAVGVFQALTQRRGDLWARAHGFVHPVSYGEIMALAWLGAFCAGRQETGARGRARQAALLVFAAALVLSQARGALLGAIFGLLALAVVHDRLRRPALAALVAVPLVLAFWELMPSDHNFSTMLKPMYAARPGHVNPFLARLTFWRVGLQMFADHPWLGVGPGNYRLVFDKYFQGMIEGESVWGSAHNLFIHQAAERGLLGLAALVGVLWALVAESWRRVKRGAGATALWAWAATAAFLVMNLTEVAFQTEQVASLYLFIWALACAQ